MKNLNRQSLLALILLSFSFFTNAQKCSFLTSATVGISSPILDNGIGYHFGINRSYAVSNHFSIEGQISYLHTKIRSAFWSGEEGQSNSVNALAGGRLYLRSPEKLARLYLNFLVGINYDEEEVNGLKKEGGINAGLSFGAFIALNKILVGVSYDTPGNSVLKIGYNF